MQYIGLLMDPKEIIAESLLYALPITLFIHFAMEIIKEIIKARRKNTGDSE